MGRFTVLPEDLTYIKKGTSNLTLIKKAKFEGFNTDILGLGKIDKKSDQINALSVLFDLEGFTNFCKQIDPQLAVPEYLSEFLKWLFEQVRKELINKIFPEGYYTYSELPLLAKFMGDGILFIWNTENMSDTKIMNIVVSMLEICKKYKSAFLKGISKKVVSPPTKLRCGIARGSIYSVGDGDDFVGPCINMSARLQKLNALTFAFSRRGLNPQTNDAYEKDFITLKTDIRGIGTEELVCVLKAEYQQLNPEDKRKFIVP